MILLDKREILNALCMGTSRNPEIWLRQVAQAQLKKVVEYIEGFTCNATTQRWKADLLETLLKEAGFNGLSNSKSK